MRRFLPSRTAYASEEYEISRLLVKMQTRKRLHFHMSSIQFVRFGGRAQPNPVREKEFNALRIFTQLFSLAEKGTAMYEVERTKFREAAIFEILVRIGNYLEAIKGDAEAEDVYKIAKDGFDRVMATPCLGGMTSKTC